MTKISFLKGLFITFLLFCFALPVYADKGDPVFRQYCTVSEGGGQSLINVDFLVTPSPSNPFEYALPSDAYAAAMVEGDRDGNGIIEICARGGDKSMGVIDYVDTIEVDTDIWPSVENGKGDEPVFFFSDGTGPEYTRIIASGDLAGRVFRFRGTNLGSISYPSRFFEVRNVTITGGEAKMSGGGVHVMETDLRLRDDIIIDNHARQGSGGGVLALNSKLLLEKVVFEENSASSNGGGVHAEDSMVESLNNRFISNVASGGGGVSMNGGVLTQMRAHYEDNHAGYSVDQCAGGGALKGASDTVLEVRSSDFYSNSSLCAGGSVSLYRGELTMDDILIKDSSAVSNGGSMNLGVADVLISDLEVWGSTSGTFGGTFYVHDSEFKLGRAGVYDSHAIRGGVLAFSNSDVSISSFVSDNTSAAEEGGVFYSSGLTGPVNFSMSNSSTNNSSANKGGVLYSDFEDGVIEIVNSGFYNSSAADIAGAMDITANSVSNGSVIFRKNTFDTNSSVGTAGAIYCKNQTNFLIENSAFLNNEASSGGAMSLNDCNMTIESTVFDGNESVSYSGGAMYVLSDSIIDMSEVDFVNNVSVQHGAGIYMRDSSLVADDLFADGNSADWYGVALGAEDSSIDLTNSEFSNNVNTGSGPYCGAVMTFDSDFSGDNLIVQDNDSGGGICFFDNGLGSFSLTDSQISNNVYGLYAGGVLIEAISNLLNVVIDGVDFIGNQSTVNGGGLSIIGTPSYSHSVTVSNSSFEGNVAMFDSMATATEGGGGLSCDNLDGISIYNTSFVGNIAEPTHNGKGGAIRAQNCGLDLNEVDLVQNLAADGGALAQFASDLNGADIEFIDNTATDVAGAIFVADYGYVGSSLSLLQSLIRGNSGYEVGAVNVDNSVASFENVIMSYNNAISDSSADALLAEGSNIDMDFVTVSGNGYQSTLGPSDTAVRIEGGFVNVMNSFFGYNNGQAFIAFSGASVGMNYTVIDPQYFLPWGAVLNAFNNGIGNFYLNGDPLFVGDGSWTYPVASSDPVLFDFHLQSGSELVDAGDPAVFDVDSTRADVGAYGGPGGGW
jgi:predicted outer membrane repeat protein